MIVERDARGCTESDGIQRAGCDGTLQFAEWLSIGRHRDLFGDTSAFEMHRLAGGQFKEISREPIGIDTNTAGYFTLEGEAAVGVGVTEQMAGRFLHRCAHNRSVGAVLDGHGETDSGLGRHRFRNQERNQERKNPNEDHAHEPRFAG